MVDWNVFMLACVGGGGLHSEKCLSCAWHSQRGLWLMAEQSNSEEKASLYISRWSNAAHTFSINHPGLSLTPMLFLTSPTSPLLCKLPLSPVSHVEFWTHLNTTYLLAGENYTFQCKVITQNWEVIHTVSLMKTSRWQRLEGTQIGV